MGVEVETICAGDGEKKSIQFDVPYLLNFSYQKKKVQLFQKLAKQFRSIIPVL